MAMTAPKTFAVGEVLSASDLNAHVTGAYPTALGAAVDGAGFDITALDEVGFNDAAANASATRRLRANAANLTWHDGTAAGRVFYAGGTDIPVADGGTGAGTFTANGVLYGNSTSAIQVTAQGGTRTILTANAGAPAWSAAPIINTSVQIGVVSSTTGTLSLANSASANLTTLQAGNATEANTYVWPADGGAANQVLTTDGATPTTALSWGTAGIAAATQAEMESASSTTAAATPGRTHYHPGVAKYWVHFNIDGTINTSYNTTSITDTAAGDHTVNIGTDFSGASWCALSCQDGGGNLANPRQTIAAGTNRIQWPAADTPFTLTDPGVGVFSAGWGDHA